MADYAKRLRMTEGKSTLKWCLFMSLSTGRIWIHHNRNNPPLPHRRSRHIRNCPKSDRFIRSQPDITFLPLSFLFLILFLSPTYSSTPSFSLHKVLALAFSLIFSYTHTHTHTRTHEHTYPFSLPLLLLSISLHIHTFRDAASAIVSCKRERRRISATEV